MDGLLRYWQRELKLLDWELSARFCEKLSVDDRYAEIGTVPERRWAQVTVQCPDMWEDGWEDVIANQRLKRNRVKVDRHIEVLLVHELSHLCIGWYRPYGQDEVLDLLDEQAIEMYSELLVRMKYADRVKG